MLKLPLRCNTDNTTPLSLLIKDSVGLFVCLYLVDKLNNILSLIHFFLGVQVSGRWTCNLLLGVVVFGHKLGLIIIFVL